jgi:hypothetical protein
VGDEDDRHAHLALEVLHQLEDLRLDRHVERGRGLVRDEKGRAAGQRHGDHRPLAHAPRHLVGVVRRALLRLGDADERQHVHRPLEALRAADALVADHRLGDLVADGVDGVQRGHRLLEDHPDLAAPDRPHLALGQAGEVAAAEQDVPAGDLARRRRQEPHDGERGHRLARSALAHDGERLAGKDVEAHAVDRAHLGAAAEDEGRLQVADGEERFGHRGSSGVTKRPVPGGAVMAAPSQTVAPRRIVRRMRPGSGARASGG